MNPHEAARGVEGDAPVHPLWHGPHIAGADYEIHIEHYKGYLAARVGGVLPIELFLSTLHIVGIESDGGDEEAMLIDLRHLATSYTPRDLIRVGHEVATSFCHMHRVALLVLPRQVTRISERAGRKAGLNLCVFDTEADATGWVRGAAA
jgi:hypothetical protein